MRPRPAALAQADPIAYTGGMDPAGPTDRAAGMPVRLRKLLGSLGVLAFLVFYVGVVGALYRFVPDNQALRLAYFAAAGMLWGAPVIPLIRWMNGGG